ncbi:hypothetical protein ACP4OV_015861 [Aristida adscensionis]
MLGGDKKYEIGGTEQRRCDILSDRIFAPPRPHHPRPIAQSPPPPAGAADPQDSSSCMANRARATEGEHGNEARVEGARLRASMAQAEGVVEGRQRAAGELGEGGGLHGRAVRW